MNLEQPAFIRTRISCSETEGRKPRPCVLAILRRRSDGLTEVLLVPITSSAAYAGKAFAVEVPPLEKRRAGLDPKVPMWVIADEFNLDVPARSFYFEAGNKVGAFSSQFVKQVQAVMIKAIQSRQAKRVNRT
ncbi:MAG: hypothetical protein MI785_09375 [Kiloniellales bacterium]|nr:hypothetical protein [Kiloniellales bacterium]